MFAIMGVSGRVGGAVARNVLEGGQPVRAIVRDAGKGTPWQGRGCEVSVASLDDDGALASALQGCQGAFVMLPPAYDQSPGLVEGKARVATLRRALLKARPAKVLALSSVGAQSPRPNLISELGHLEAALADVDLPITFLRPAWYIENAEWDVAGARDEGVIHSHLQPLDRAIPMVSIEDVGRVAAKLLMDDWAGHRVVELEGPQKVSAARMAQAFALALGREVRAEAVPRDQWESWFRDGAGIGNPLPWMQSLDGFNEGWLDFEGGSIAREAGRITIDEAVGELVKRHQR